MLILKTKLTGSEREIINKSKKRLTQEYKHSKITHLGARETLRFYGLL